MKHFKLFLIFVVLLTIGTTAYGQDVTVRANNGSCVAAIKNGGVGDTFFLSGGFATWQHEQLNLVLTASDGKVLTPNEQLDNPANNLYKASDGVHMQIGKGQATGADTCYITISLPKGYRFKEYSIDFSKAYEQKSYTYNGRTNTSDFRSNITARFGETDKKFNYYITQADVTNNGGTKNIARTEMTDGDMGNVLYFKLIGATYNNGYNAINRALITLENAKFYFTAEENYSPITPAGPIISPTSAVDIPFSTSKVDFGAISNNEYTVDGTTVKRVSYSSANVHDLEALFTLYEAESTTNGTDVDGISGKVVEYKEGTITSAGGFFKLGKQNEEQVYYIETPTSVEISDAESHKVPVGYRITGVEYAFTKDVTTVATRSFYITYDYEYTYTTGFFNPTTHTATAKGYLNTDGRYTTTPVVWNMDADGYIYSGSGNNLRYLYFNNGYAATQRQKPGNTERFGISENGNIFQIIWPTYYICYEESAHTQNATRTALISKDSGQRAKYEEITHTSGSSSVSDDFKLYVYDKEGKNPQEISVSEYGTVSLTGLNNDAVKFGVKGIGFINATLTIQALDPYLSHMTVVCQDEVQTAVRMTEGFDATDFSVNGGTFYFHLPADCEGHSVAITYEDLKNDYLDNTYTGVIGE